MAAKEILLAGGEWKDWQEYWGNNAYYNAFQEPPVVNGTVRIRLDVGSYAWGYKGCEQQTAKMTNNLDSTAWTVSVPTISENWQEHAEYNSAWFDLPEKYAGKMLTFEVNQRGIKTATVPAVGYLLEVIAGEGATVTVNRTSTANSLADKGVIKAGDPVYAGDVLEVTATAAAGYTITGGTGTKTVTVADHTVTVTTAAERYSLIVTKGSHANVTVLRGSEQLQSGATIHRGEVLAVTMTADSGYSLTVQSIKNAGVETTSPVAVSGDVVILAATAALNTVHIDSGSGYDAAVIKYDTGTEWKDVQAYYDTGAELVPLS